MSEAIADILRGTLAVLGLLALADASAGGPVLTVAVMAIAALLLVVAAVTATRLRPPRGSAAHPTRRAELEAPLAQSDPDAAGHVRRRGPGRVTAAA